MENYILWKVAMLEVNYQRILKILLNTILVEFFKILKSSYQNTESLLFRMWAIGPPRKWWRRWVVYMCFSFLQLAPLIIQFISSWWEKNCYVKLSKLKIVQDEQRCHFMNLLSFTLQLLSSQLEIYYVIQEPT